MIGNILAIAAFLAACDAALIPLSTSWPTQTAYGRSGGCGLSYLQNSGNLDYNQLFHVLYPEVTSDPLDDINLSLFSNLPQVGTGLEINELYRTLYPGVRGSNRVMLPNRELSLGGSFRRSARINNYDGSNNNAEFRGDSGEFDDCRRCQKNGNCDCRECGEVNCNCECGGCTEGRCMSGGCCECRNCCQQRNCCEHNNVCNCGSCSNCGCNKPMSTSSSRSGCNCRCESSGSNCQKNMQCCSCRCTKMQGQCCCSPICY